MKFLDILFCTLLIVGGLNWGLVGVADFNLVEAVFGMGTLLTKVVYDLVGLSAIYKIFQCRSIHNRWCGRKIKRAHQMMRSFSRLFLTSYICR
jgi:uncharacterized membrane protein YuzA (DUF378 family)